MNYIIFLVKMFFDVYILLIVARAILPWIPHNRYNPAISFIYEVTDPVLFPIREGMPPIKIGIDASPFIAIILLWLLQQIVLAVLSIV